MIKESSAVIIVQSVRLEDMKLTGLVGARAIVTEDLVCNGRKNKGYMVCLIEPYLEKYIWFVPQESVKIDE
ncbi:hypothetical protein [Dysgonomonas sp. ZJ709]|uniref:hypothetical protein n=1 Tax=Dysgonomonas sp. ZJ709 TaxID=2709797 RepID=UPI0013EB41D5|nr:hypothetical protein [Dysgonomonas sp. ZJ709]